MGLLKEFIEGYKQKREKEKEYEEDIRMQKRVMAKMKSADDRELEGYMEEMRKARVAKQLEVLRKRKAETIWRSNPFRNNKNLFKNKPMFRCRNV